MVNPAGEKWAERWVTLHSVEIPPHDRAGLDLAIAEALPILMRFADGRYPDAALRVKLSRRRDGKDGVGSKRGWFVTITAARDRAERSSQ